MKLSSFALIAFLSTFAFAQDPNYASLPECPSGNGNSYVTPSGEVLTEACGATFDPQYGTLMQPILYVSFLPEVDMFCVHFFRNKI